MINMATPEQNRWPRGHEIFNFGRPFFGHCYSLIYARE